MKTLAPSAYSQRGLSSLSWLLLIAVTGFFMMCAFKLIPHYAENIYIADGLKTLGQGEKPVADMSKREIKKTLDRFYMMNNVRSEGSKNLDLDRTKKGLLVNVNYEVRVPLFANVDVLLTFENQLDSSDPSACCKPKTKIGASK